MQSQKKEKRLISYTNVLVIANKFFNMLEVPGPFTVSTWKDFLTDVSCTVSINRMPVLSRFVPIVQQNDVSNPNVGTPFYRGMKSKNAHRRRPNVNDAGVQTVNVMSLGKDNSAQAILLNC